ncbi:TPR-like protein [Hyaloscypha variabilis]
MDSAAISPTVIIRSRRELEPYGDLILELCQPGMKFERLSAALADRGVYASKKIVRSVREGLNQRKYIRRDHKERMIGIYRRWKDRNVIIKYEGRIQTFAKLKRTIAFKGKKYHLDEEHLVRLEGYTGPTPKEIFYFDPNDPNTNLLEADGCDWDPAEKDEALRYAFGDQAEECCTIDLQIRIDTSSTAPPSTASAIHSPDRQKELEERILPVLNNPPKSIWEWLSSAQDDTQILSGEESQSLRTMILDLYAKLYGNTEYDLHRMEALSQKFLDRGMLDAADKVASSSVALAKRLYGFDAAQTLIAVVDLTRVRTQQGKFQEAYNLGAAAVKVLKDTLGDFDRDVLLSECCLCEILLELDQMDRAKELCCDVLRRSLAGINVTHEAFDLFRCQLARICNARAEYSEAKEILEDIVRDRDYRLGIRDERTLRASVELVHSLCGLGDWDAVTRASQIEKEIEGRVTIGVPREIWNLELVQSVGLQLHSLGAYFEAEKVFRCHLDCLRGMIQFPGHPRLICAESWVASALHYQRRSKEAGAINKRLSKAAECIWGPHHRITLALMSNEAWCMDGETVFEVFENRMVEVRELSIKHLGDDDPDTLDSKRFCANVKIIRGEWEESLATLEKIYNSHKDRHDRKSRIKLLETLLESGKILCRRCHDFKAEALLKQALELGKCLFGPHHPRALAPLAPLGFCLGRLGRYSEAEELLGDGILALTGSLGHDHYQVMVMELARADILGLQSRPANAAEIQSRVLEHWSKNYGDHHPYAIDVAGRLARSYAEQDMVVEAHILLDKAIKSSGLTFGPEHPRTCNLELSLATMFRDQSNLTQALSLSRKILEVAHASFGTIADNRGISSSSFEHPYSLPFLDGLATIHKKLGDITSSIKLSKKILTLRSKLQGPNHPDTITALSNLASVYSSASEYLAAEPLYRDVVERSTVAFGDGHARTFAAILYHGRALRGLRRYTESIAIFNTLLDKIFRQWGECHNSIAEIYEDLAILNVNRGRYDEAVGYFNHALRVYRKLNDKSAVVVMIDLCTCYIIIKAYSKAEHQAQEAVSEAEKIFGLHHPVTINARIQQASALLGNEKYVEVDELTDALRQDIESREGKDSTRVLRVEQIYGRSLRAQGRLKEAESFLESSINTRPHKDPRDPETSLMILLLGDIKEELGKLHEKEAVLQDLLDKLETRNSSDAINGSFDPQLANYTDVLEALARTRSLLNEYESAESLMRKVFALRIEYWGEDSQQACDAERNLANCLPEDRLLDRFNMQTQILDKYWISGKMDIESSTSLLRDIADTCSRLRHFEYEATVRERIISLTHYPSDSDQYYVWDVQKMSLARSELGQFAEVEENLELLNQVIRSNSPPNLRDLAWTLQLLAQTKNALGKLDEAADILQESLLAGTQNPTEIISDNLDRLDLLVELNMKLYRWDEAKYAWDALLSLREEAEVQGWSLPVLPWERLQVIEEKLGDGQTLSDGEPP